LAALNGNVRATWIIVEAFGLTVGDGLLGLSPDEWTAVRLSLRIATTAMVVNLPFGILIAYVLARFQFPGKMLLDGFVHLPLVLPPVVVGYILLIVLGRRGFLGEFFADYLGIVFSFRWTGAAVASAVMGFPLMVRPMRLSIEAIDQRLEDAAATLGANGLWTFALVTLPLALPGVVVGAILCFARALGEFGATITFVSNIPGETQTISAAIYTYTQVPGGDADAWRLTAVAIAMALVALVASEFIARIANRRLAQFQ
jgi:molybdate transport system permease protein